MMHVGLDICELNRIDLKNDRFIHFVLSDEEYDVFLSRKDQLAYLGGRWAVKEAFIKALRANNKNIPLREIIVLNDDNGAPYVVFHSKIYDNVSISHERDYAVGIVILQ